LLFVVQTFFTPLSVKEKIIHC